MNEPVADTVRGILDGHIVLSRDLASRNHYPAIDILNSVSRLMPDITDAQHRRAAGAVRDILATYKQSEDLVNIGAYVHGSNPRIDYALAKIDDANTFLKQAVDERSEFDAAGAALVEMISDHAPLSLSAADAA